MVRSSLELQGISPRWRSSWPVVLWLVAPAVAAGALALVAMIVSRGDGAAASAWCAIRRWTEVPCPGCGMTRAFGHLAIGEWRHAWQFHPLAPLLAVELALGWALFGLKLIGLELRWLWSRLDELLLFHVIVLGALWLGRLATGTLPW